MHGRRNANSTRTPLEHMNTQAHTIHRAGDGLGPRDVTLSGEPIAYVVYADVKHGVVKVVGCPAVWDKQRGRVVTKTLRGVVAVTPHER